jgi:hemoglobin-like flavoprotein
MFSSVTNNIMSEDCTMAIEKTTVNEVNQSLGRCFLHSGFMDKFYANFKASHPSIPPFFVKTNMATQHKLLKEGITFLLMSAGGSGFAQTEMKKLGVRHDTAHLNVKPELYRYWIDSLMKTVLEFDQDFTPELDKKWRMILQAGIQQMIDTYQAPKKAG